MSSVSSIRYSLISRVRAKIASVTPSGAGPPLAVLNLMPKSSSGPPGLWLAERMMPPLVLVFADKAGGGRRGEQAALANNDPGHAVGSRHAQNDLDRMAVVITAVTAENQRAALEVRLGVEDRLDKVFQVMGRLENPDLFAQTGGAGALVGKGPGADGRDIHAGLSVGVIENEYMRP